MALDSREWDPGENTKSGSNILPYTLPTPLQPIYANPEKKNDEAIPDDTEHIKNFKESPSRRQTVLSTASTGYKLTVPPPLSFDPRTKKLSITICILGLLFFDLVLPCLIYYLLHTLTDLDEADVLGIACASLGIGELFELPLRGWRLVRHREEYAPLGQTAKWAFDFFFWWYAAATVVGIVPYVMATDLDYAIEWLFLMSPGLIVGFAVLTAAVSMVPFRLPVRISSDAKGEMCKPFVYYVIEDFVAVDSHQKRSYREELRVRYQASHMFRVMIWEVNLWWTVGGLLFIGGLAGVTWGVSFPIAYGVSLALLFVWIGVWSLATFWWVKRALQMERVWFLQPVTGINGAMDQDIMV